MKKSKLALCIGLALPPVLAPAQDSSEEIVVVTGTRTEIAAKDSPVAIDVITDVDIERTPADDMGDLLRNVPGLNVAQTSARDINVTGRGSTNTLANSLLTLMDGRSTYLDFFGINMWDLIPVETNEIKQIEVIRGPGSALYGANAMSGVVNIITKRPQEMIGTTATVGTGYANVVHADGDDDFSYKLTAGYFEEDAYDRPSGLIPGSNAATYPEYRNDGTTQKRVNTRFDWGLADGSYITVGAGLAQTDGIIHSGIGPFDIDSGTELSYWQADWHRDQLHVGVSAQMLDGDATNLLTRDASSQPLGFRFINDTYNIEVTNTNSFGERHLMTYGGNLRTHDFELTIAPEARNKDEWGIFVQDDIQLAEKLRWVVGVRYDDIDPLKDTVLTPRTSLIYSFSPAHTFRVSYNEAFRTPSTINNFLDVSILQPLPGGIAIIGDAVGNVGLTEESLKAYEIGYVGTFSTGMEITVSVYRNETKGSIDFYESDHYDAANLPTPLPGWPAGLELCFIFDPGTAPVPGCPGDGLAGEVPSEYSYRNIGKSIDRGIEFSIKQDFDDVYWWANLSWQDAPDITGADLDEVNRPPEWRFNLGVGADDGDVFWNATINHQDSSYWADVLFAKAATDSFTQLNASLGWRFRNDSMVFKLIGQNLSDERVQQHIFGDILDRRIDAQVSFSF